MLFQSRGWLCTATICQALAQTADGQTGVATPTPSPLPSIAEADSWKLEAPNQELQPDPTDANPEQEAGWSGELVEPVLENKPIENVAPVPPDPRATGLGLFFGVIDVRPRMRFSAAYDDNILISSNHQKADFVYTLSPGVLAGIGDYIAKEYNFISLEYVPSLTLFQRNPGLNALEQHLLFDGQYTFSRLTLLGNFQYDKLSGPDRDIGGRVNRDIYRASLGAKYAISDKTSVDTDGVVSFRHYQNQIGSKEFVNHNWLNFSLTPKVNVSAGAAFGVLEPDNGGTQTYQQGLFRVGYVSTAKLTFNGNVGVEFRQFGKGGGSRVTPVFGLGAAYEFTPSTKINLTGSRSVTNSASINGDNYTATSVSATFSQHLIGNFSVGLEGGYENDAYSRAVTNAETGGRQRMDNYFYIGPHLTYRWKDWAQISLSYLYRENDSNFSTKSFTNNQVWLGVGFGF